MEVKGEVEVEVEEGRGRIECKVVEQLKRWSSKHRPNYLTFCTKSYKMFCDFFLFIFIFLRYLGRRERMSLQPSWVVNTDIF